jgi:hypothetical protein
MHSQLAINIEFFDNKALQGMVSPDTVFQGL